MFQDLSVYIGGVSMYKVDYKVSYKLTRRNKLILAEMFNSIIKQRVLNGDIITLSFILVRSPRYTTTRYWKIFVTDKTSIVDVSRDIGIILNLNMYNNDVIRTSSYGVSIEDGICSALERTFKHVYKNPVRFDYRFFDATLE